MHTESHPLADRTVLLREDVVDTQRGLVVGGRKFTVKDWWDLLVGESWMDARSTNFACYWYSRRRRYSGLPYDDEVVYGHIYPDDGGVGLSHLVHITELGEEI